MMIMKFTTTRALGMAIALTVGSVASAAAQQTGTGSTTGTRSDTMSTRSGTSGSTTGRRSGVRVSKDAGSTTGTMGGSTSGSMGGSTSGTMGGSTTGTMGGSTTGTMGGTTTDSTMTTGGAMGGTMGGSTTGTMGGSTMGGSTSGTMSGATTETTTTTTTTTSAGELPPMGGARFGNGIYLGLHGGANFPQNDINSYYETGYNVGGQVGWDPQNSPLGLRLNLNWNRLNGADIANTVINGIRYEADLPNADLYSAFGDAKLRLPFGRFLGSTSGLYAVGGGGVTYFRNYNTFGGTTGTPAGNSVINTFNNEDVTRFALNGGGGVSWGIGPVSLFVEGRYVRVFTQSRDTDYVPVTVGLTFH